MLFGFLFPLSLIQKLGEYRYRAAIFLFLIIVVAIISLLDLPAYVTADGYTLDNMNYETHDI